MRHKRLHEFDERLFALSVNDEIHQAGGEDFGCEVAETTSTGEYLRAHGLGEGSKTKTIGAADGFFADRDVTRLCGAEILLKRTPAHAQSRCIKD